MEMRFRSGGSLLHHPHGETSIMFHDQHSRAEALHPTVNIATISNRALVVKHMAKAALCILAGVTVGRLKIQMHLTNIRDSGFNRYSVCLNVMYTSLTVVPEG
jgi:hypothetical protein